MVKIHEKYISRCIQLAENALGATYPNPMVGSVLVYDDQIIGEGWHHKAGEPHAEVNAIRSVRDESLLKKATIYVSLEPCSHYGKTPPCSDLIIASGIKKVVIGTVDTFAKVSGNGIKKLIDAGCEVRVGILEKACKDLNKRFFTFHEKKRPYIILKWAQTQDGFLAPNTRNERKPVWITNSVSNQLVHKWRSEEQAILVGTNTAVEDDPKLTTRLWTGNNPCRVVIDQHLRVPKNSALFDGNVKTIFICGKSPESSVKRDQKNLIFDEIDFKKNIPTQICEVLYRHEIQSVIIEGGAKTLQTFIDEDLWDEARVFTGNIQFGKGTKSPGITGNLVEEKTTTLDNLKIYRND